MSRPHRGRGEQRPCDFCRIRKTRCLVRDSPPCEKCLKVGRTCTFEHEPPPRRRNDAAEALASLAHSSTPPVAPAISSTLGLGLDFQLNRDMMLQYTDGMNMPMDFNWNTYQYLSSSSFNVPEAYDTGIGNHPAVVSPNSVSSTTRQDQSQSLASSLAVSEENAVEQSHDSLLDGNTIYSTSFLGASAELDPFLRQFYRFNSSSHFQSALRGFQIIEEIPSESPIFLETPRQVTQNMTDLLMANPAVPSLVGDMDPYKSKLTSLFHRFISPCYPVLGPPNQFSRTIHATIYGLALPWRSHDPTLPWAQFDSRGVTRLNVPDVNILWQYVWQQISRELHAPTYGTLQACLLLMERGRSKPFVADTPFDWTLVSMAVSVAYTLGLHLDSSSWQISQEEQSQRQRMWWLVYTQERWIAMTMGRPLLIREDDFTVLAPENINGFTEDNRSNDGQSLKATFFLHLTSLTFLLDKIYHGFLTIKREAQLRCNISQAIVASNQIHNELNEWSAVSLGSLVSSPQDSSDFSSPIGVLLIASIYCHTILYRSILKVTIRTPHFADYFSEVLLFGSEIRKSLERLTLLHLESFWFSWSRGQFNAIADFMALLCVIAPSDEAKQRARSIATAHREWLWLRSKSFEISRPSMVRLDSLLASIDNGDLSMET